MTSTMKIEYGNQVWRDQDGKRHRLDGPAVICFDGTEHWFMNGKLHRLDGPATVYADGSKEWYLDGLRHRSDGPAVVYVSGIQAWWVNGKRHRLDGPAYIEDELKEWWVNYNFVDPGFISQKIKHNPPTPKEQKLLMDFWGPGSS